MDNVKSHPEISLTKLTPDLARRRLRIIGASYDKTALTKYNAERIAKYIESNNPVDFEYSEIQTTHCFIDRRLEMIKIVAGILETWINM